MISSKVHPMNLLHEFWGSGTSLNVLQMVCRGIAVFVLALVLIRISGRRSFGLGSPLDNIIVILLGAVLSRAVVGASPFIPVAATSTVIVLLHRILSWYKSKNSPLSRLLEGDKIILFEKGNFIPSNMRRALLNKEDILQEVRKTALTDDLSTVKIIFIERSGEISVVKKPAD